MTSILVFGQPGEGQQIGGGRIDLLDLRVLERHNRGRGIRRVLGSARQGRASRRAQVVRVIERCYLKRILGVRGQPLDLGIGHAKALLHVDLTAVRCTDSLVEHPIALHVDGGAARPLHPDDGR